MSDTKFSQELLLQLLGTRQDSSFLHWYEISIEKSSASRILGGRKEKSSSKKLVSVLVIGVKDNFEAD